MSNKLRFQTGGPLEPSTLRIIDDRNIRAVANDGQVMFEIYIADGRSIEVRAVNRCMVDGVLTSVRLALTPLATNCVAIGVHDYE